MPVTSRPPNIKLGYVLSDTLLGVNMTAWTVGLTLTKVAAATVIHDIYPSCKFRFHVWCGSSGGSTYYTIYRNGVAVSSEQGPFNGADADRGAVDLTFTDMKVTDTFEIWARNTGGAGQGHGSEFTISGTETPFYNSL